MSTLLSVNYKYISRKNFCILYSRFKQTNLSVRFYKGNTKIKCNASFIIQTKVELKVIINNINVLCDEENS